MPTQDFPASPARSGDPITFNGLLNEIINTIAYKYPPRLPDDIDAGQLAKALSKERGKRVSRNLADYYLRKMEEAGELVSLFVVNADTLRPEKVYRKAQK